MADADIAATKVCAKCAQVRPINDFRARTQNGWQWRSGTCRPCEREYSRKWKADNAERDQTRKREWRMANLERCAAQSRKYRKLNPDKVAERNRDYYERLKSDDRPKLREQRRASKTARRAREKGATGTFSPRDVANMRKAQDGRCWYCSQKTGSLEVEHRIPLSRGGTNDPSNLVLSCGPCNKRKMTKMPWEMEAPRLV